LPFALSRVHNSLPVMSLRRRQQRERDIVAIRRFQNPSTPSVGYDQVRHVRRPQLVGTVSSARAKESPPRACRHAPPARRTLPLGGTEAHTAQLAVRRLGDTCAALKAALARSSLCGAWHRQGRSFLSCDTTLSLVRCARVRTLDLEVSIYHIKSSKTNSVHTTYELRSSRSPYRW
jgi:hypothetical protein